MSTNNTQPGKIVCKSGLQHLQTCCTNSKTGKFSNELLPESRLLCYQRVKSLTPELTYLLNEIKSNYEQMIGSHI